MHVDSKLTVQQIIDVVCCFYINNSTSKRENAITRFGYVGGVVNLHFGRCTHLFNHVITHFIAMQLIMSLGVLVCISIISGVWIRHMKNLFPVIHNSLLILGWKNSFERLNRKWFVRSVLMQFSALYSLVFSHQIKKNAGKWGVI